jgi:Right handed beta helix region
LIGIQLENSQFCTIANNRVYNNRIGVLVDKTPGYTPQGTEFSTSNNFIYSNIITNNNSSIQSSEGLPTGAGMILAGADKTTIVGNQVSNNKSAGILVSSFTCPPPGCGALPFDLVPDGNKIVWNIVRKNGNAPDPSIGPLAADLSWDTTGHNNCWEHNQFGTSFLPSLPSCN